MSYVVKLKRSAEKELDRLPVKTHKRIVKVLLSLKEDPIPHGAKKLHGRDDYRIRVGNYRILYMIDESDKKVEVLSVAHRKEVYRL
jgi:mRNA interferase RelE/StbE